ncbi:MAG: hypothetical protein BGO03_07535 [Mesorhizobium sp. 61-13]|nr:MAG: hypothetical protein BGO03_07535 [Mesorhizobium sp. 61-13]
MTKAIVHQLNPDECDRVAADLTAVRKDEAAAHPDPPCPPLLQIAIGREVREWRRYHDLNGLDLANAAGISLGMLSRIENGTVAPSMGTLQAIAGALGLPLTSLLRRPEKNRGATFVKRSSPDSRSKVVLQNMEVVRDNPCGSSVSVDARIVVLAEQEIELIVEENGVVVLYCLEGEFNCIRAQDAYRLSPGDTLILRDLCRCLVKKRGRDRAAFVCAHYHPTARTSAVAGVDAGVPVASA